jgi:hypothetical protein
MSSVESFGWRSLLFARHSPGFGGCEAEGKELEEEGMRPEEEEMPSEEETARLTVPFGWPAGEGMGLDRRGMRHEGLFGRREDLFG